MPSAPPPQGKQRWTHELHVDSDHVGDVLTRRFRSGYLVHMNLAFKKQSTCGTSVFGAEFVVLKTAMESNERDQIRGQSDRHLHQDDPQQCQERPHCLADCQWASECCRMVQDRCGENCDLS